MFISYCINKLLILYIIIENSSFFKHNVGLVPNKNRPTEMTPKTTTVAAAATVVAAATTTKTKTTTTMLVVVVVVGMVVNTYTYMVIDQLMNVQQPQWGLFWCTYFQATTDEWGNMAICGTESINWSKFHNNTQSSYHTQSQVSCKHTPSNAVWRHYVSITILL